MPIVEYDSNNSGGSWWLTETQWDALESAGWTVHWVTEYTDEEKAANSYCIGYKTREYDRSKLLEKRTKSGLTYLGAKTVSAAKEFDNPADAIPDWEAATGADASAYGCSCCGPPHTFAYVDSNGEHHYASAEISETVINFT